MIAILMKLEDNIHVQK